MNACGDGCACGTEEGDDGNGSDVDACLTSCTRARCGDGVVRAELETCDDGVDNGAQCGQDPDEPTRTRRRNHTVRLKAHTTVPSRVLVWSALIERRRCDFGKRLSAVNLSGYEAGNGGNSQGDTYDNRGSSSTRSLKEAILRWAIAPAFSCGNLSAPQIRTRKACLAR